ncbi:PREDICTED: NADH dehydrogenase [ubiquinone] 1 alpha subcomplex subunit 10, mitochondrial [Nicrophorus vespilloides]|uniref:NADH dehydrogenase [ubiquinone] 1 alpha subcomplex subunit 10, mitochondrial n=1 Tax=Nicrophorus vespilloides TaxID=110193 RepID=A0ABM1MZC3_NICVS|nr:PREDICTED: NADH dehydrogenase [ubiquinone] 1 alpha subcomplex subunit 10, mitochondrial [Nicrophorus vespilloides]
MGSLIRISFGRLSGTCKLLNRKNIEFVGLRCISGKTIKLKDPSIVRPAPWDYKERRYTWFHSLYDKTTSRFDENSKIVIVEGPVAAGKTKFAKTLADELDMLYMPEANLDMNYINNYGYDLRKLDEQVPESCRSFDVNNFLLNPQNRLTANFQMEQYIVKFSQYIDALAHLLSTGQGVVLDRSVYSDFVFMEAMCKNGYVSKPARSAYYELRQNTIEELMRPHLVIYLDVPVPKVLENIKERSISYEVNSKVLTPEYLSEMETNYKQKYLKEISKHAELLVYDWSEGGDPEVVVEDIERIDFAATDNPLMKMKDWDFRLEEEWACARNRYADDKNNIMMMVNIPRFDVPEFVISHDDYKAYVDALKQAPGEKYQLGYNTDLGDTGLLFKSKLQKRVTLPLRERRCPDAY